MINVGIEATDIFGGNVYLDVRELVEYCKLDS